MHGRSIANEDVKNASACDEFLLLRGSLARSAPLVRDLLGNWKLVHVLESQSLFCGYNLHSNHHSNDHSRENNHPGNYHTSKSHSYCTTATVITTAAALTATTSATTTTDLQQHYHAISITWIYFKLPHSGKWHWNYSFPRQISWRGWGSWDWSRSRQHEWWPTYRRRQRKRKRMLRSNAALVAHGRSIRRPGRWRGRRTSRWFRCRAASRVCAEFELK